MFTFVKELASALMHWDGGIGGTTAKPAVARTMPDSSPTTDHKYKEKTANVMLFFGACFIAR
jgi:hypothetical protein